MFTLVKKVAEPTVKLKLAVPESLKAWAETMASGAEVSIEEALVGALVYAKASQEVPPPATTAPARRTKKKEEPTQ